MTQEKDRSYRSYSFEGLDGAGKTSHIQALVEYLESMGVRVVVKASPQKDSLTGKILRANIKKMDPSKANKLFTYDIRRSDREIPPHTQVVLWDRHLDTIRTSNTDEDEVNPEGVQLPDETFYLAITPETSWEREQKNTDHPIDKGWLVTKDRRYQKLIEGEPERFIMIDAAQPLEAVYQQILAFLTKEMGSVLEKQQALHNLLMDIPGGIRFVLDNPVEVKPGVLLPMFVNVKAAMAQPEAREQLTREMAALAKEGKYDAVMGLESGGSYFAVSIANELGLPVLFHRTKSKIYSANEDIVGEPPKEGSKVLLIDDVYATGQSSNRANKKLEQLGCQAELITVYSYSSDSEMKKRLGINATALTYFKGIRRLAQERGMLDEAQAQEVTRLVDIYRNTQYE